MHNLNDDRTAENDNRYGDNHTEEEKSHVTAGRTDYTENIIQTHKCIGYNDSFNGTAQRILSLYMSFFFTVLLADKLHTDIYE